jgi:hypothetical protein
MLRWLDVFSMWVKAESGIGEDWAVLELLDPED